MIARVDGSAVNLWSRVAKDWTAAFTAIRNAVADVPVGSATLDGEAVYPPGERKEFHGLQSRAGQAEAVLVAFDLPLLDGEDLRQLPLEERRAKLAGLLAKIGSRAIVLSEAFEGDGPTVFRRACIASLVPSNASSRYSLDRLRFAFDRIASHSGRSPRYSFMRVRIVQSDWSNCRAAQPGHATIILLQRRDYRYPPVLRCRTLNGKILLATVGGIADCLPVHRIFAA